MARVVLVDNADSFTFNIYQYLLETGAAVDVLPCDGLTPDHPTLLGCDGIVLSPGPGAPAEAVAAHAVLARYADVTPILGVCLGHQVICEHFGGRVVRAGRVMHAKVSQITHDGQGVFAGLPEVFDVARYHSLIADAGALPDSLTVTCHSTAPDGTVEIMGLRHHNLPIEGVQFHPEAIQSQHGHALLARFVEMC